MYGWSKISTTKLIAFCTKSMACFVSKIWHYFARKCMILNIYFQIFFSGNTPGHSLWEGTTPFYAHRSTAFGNAWGRKRLCSTSPPVFSTNRRPFPHHFLAGMRAIFTLVSSTAEEYSATLCVDFAITAKNGQRDSALAAAACNVGACA